MTMKRLINVMDLNLRLRALREEFQSARPLLAEETRDFTYDKPTYTAGRGTKGVIGSEVQWVTVTEPVRVRLRQHGIPRVEERIHAICEEIIKVKQQIHDLGDVPEGWEMVKSNKREEGYA